MKAKLYSNELVAGIFVILMVVAFLVFLSWISGGIDRMFAPKNTAISRFHNLGGLKEKVQVTYMGLPIGDVEKIGFNPKLGLIEVRMKLRADFKLPERAIAMITTASLLGDPYVEITTDFKYVDMKSLVMGDNRVVEKDGVIQIDAIDPASWGMIQVQIGNMISDVQQKVNVMSDTLGRVLTGAELLVADPKFRGNVHQIAADLANDLPPAVREARAMMTSGNSAVQRVDRLLARSEDTVARIIENVDEATLSARTLAYGLAERPSRLVWEDKDWTTRVQQRDTALISASLRSASPNAATGGSAATPVARRSGNPTAFSR
jgi:hypothetical protein